MVDIMSTRGHVGIKENGKYTYIYNHHDSYIHGLGITLYQHYKDVDKVRELIAFGNTSSIGSTVEGSERCELGDGKPIETEYLSDVLGEDFTYIFDVEENRWYVAYWKDKYILRDLKAVLHSKTLLEKLFSEMYTEEYLPTFYEKCLNA